MTYRELAVALPKLSQAEVLQGIRELTEENFISCDMAGKACGLGGNTIRLQAREDRRTGTDMLGFRCLVARNRVVVHRNSFLAFMDGVSHEA